MKLSASQISVISMGLSFPPFKIIGNETEGFQVVHHMHDWPKEMLSDPDMNVSFEYRTMDLGMAELVWAQECAKVLAERIETRT